MITVIIVIFAVIIIGYISSTIIVAMIIIVVVIVTVLIHFPSTPLLVCRDGGEIACAIEVRRCAFTSLKLTHRPLSSSFLWLIFENPIR